MINVIVPSGNVIKKDLHFFEVYGKVLYTINDNWALGANYYYTPSFLNSGADGHYVSGTVKWTAPGTLLPMGLGMYISGEFGRQFLGTSDSFYGTGIVDPVSAWDRSRSASTTATTTPGTPASASPTRCSRSTCATPAPT